jgi:NADPH-dependent curcumin reductase CurA
MSTQNRQITLAGRPTGFPSESDFKLVTAEMPKPAAGECLIQGLYLSVDPYMRGRMREGPSYAAPVEVGQLMVGGVVGRVIESDFAGLRPGDIVEGYLGWQEYAVAPGKSLRKVDPSLAPISTALGVLGMPGLTAYFGLLDIGDPRPGETVVVSGAAGAVGATAGQIAKIRGCRVVGIAGSDEKIRQIVEELGFDGGCNYKSARNLTAELKHLCPDGVDVYFDNVGGRVTDAVFPLLNVRARVAVCGQISQYNLESAEMGPRLLWHLIVKRAKAQGFLVFDYASRYNEALRQLSEWVKQGKIHYRERIVDGIENAPRAFLEMMQGKNIGKQLVRLSAE